MKEKDVHTTIFITELQELIKDAKSCKIHRLENSTDTIYDNRVVFSVSKQGFTARKYNDNEFRQYLERNGIDIE